MQVTAFTFSCLVALPSFVQTANADSCGYNGGCDTSYGTRPNPWGGGWGRGSPDPPSCNYIGCESEEDDDDGGDPDPPACNSSNSANTYSSYSSIGLPVYTKSGLIQSISSGNLNNANQCTLTPIQKTYCDKMSTLLNASFATLRVTRTASTGYSIANLSFEAANLTYKWAFIDIERRFSTGLNIGQQIGGVIAWQDHKIDWTKYSWSGSGKPTIDNEGVYQIFAAFLLDLGQGSGIAGLPRPGGNNDSSWSCPGN